MKPLAAMAFAVALSACSSMMESRWQHPTIPPDQWSVDAAQCRHEARKKAEDDVLDSYGYGGDGTIDETDQAFLQADVNKRARELFARCMRELGYRPVE